MDLVKAASFGKALAGLKTEPLWGAAIGGGAGLLAGHLTRDKGEDASTLKNLGRTAMYGLGGGALGFAGGAAYPDASRAYKDYAEKKRIHAQINRALSAMQSNPELLQNYRAVSNPAMSQGF